MTSYSLSLIQTWLFLANSTDPKLDKSKQVAIAQLERSFGSVQMASIWVEQELDKSIEVVLI